MLKADVCVIAENRCLRYVAFPHLFGFLHSIAGRVSDLWRGLGVDFIVELKQKDDN